MNQHMGLCYGLDACDKGLLIHESPKLSGIMEVHFIPSAVYPMVHCMFRHRSYMVQNLFMKYWSFVTITV